MPCLPGCEVLLVVRELVLGGVDERGVKRENRTEERGVELEEFAEKRGVGLG